MTNSKRNHVVIPFNKDRMTFQEMASAVQALAIIINRWHLVNKKRLEEIDRDGFSESYEEMTDEFFWDVDQQINRISTHALELQKEKGND